MNSAPKSFIQIIALPIIVLVIASVFGSFYWGCLKNDLPLSYEGDAFPVMMGIKGYATGESNPFLPRYLHQLNAPFVGAWSDFPREKMIDWPAGILVRFFGIVNGTSLFVLILQIMAGISFYACGRVIIGIREKQDVLASCAILFGLAPYAFLRNLQHLALTAYWHIPLLITILIWFGWRERVFFSRQQGIAFSCASAFLAGNLNPYYLGPFLIILSLLALGKLIERQWNDILLFFAVVASAVAGFLIQNIDTFLYIAQHGKNPAAVSRNLWWMVKFGLYFPDLLIPRAHQNEFINKIAWSLYHGRVPQELWGESQTVYIGIVAGIGFVAMLLLGVAWISARKYEKVSPFFWLGTGIVTFSIAGGLNYLLGAFGFLLLRATARSSIIISCIALYFVCENIPSRIGKKWRISLSVLLVMVGVWDQLPRYPKWEQKIRERAWADYQSDARLFPWLESQLQQGAMVFELPVKDYPEMGPVREMGDYEHLRPVLHTKELRFSYGTIKGRGDTDWQKTVASKTPADMIAELERYGFSAILINRKAYKDTANTLKSSFEMAGATLLCQNADFIIFRLMPSPSPELPLIGSSKMTSMP